MSENPQVADNFNSMGHALQMRQNEKCKDLMVKSQTGNTTIVFFFLLNMLFILMEIY